MNKANFTRFLKKVLSIKEGSTDVPNPKAYFDYVRPDVFTVVNT
jgi:hypothetical protein